MSDHEQPFSASSISTQASFQGPWSAVNHTRVQANAAHMNFNSTSAGQLQNDHYAGSSYDGLSIDSSPLAQGIRTPSSTRSPLFGQAQLSGSVGSCNSHIHVHDHQNETPRPLQTSFLPTRETDLDFMGLNPQLHESKHRQRRRQVQREPTHSPVSDYVMVEPENEPTRTPSYAGSTKAEPSTSAPRSPTIFVPEQYPPSADSAKQQSSHYVIRKTRDGKRAGGRSLGMHLPADKAARAKLLREEGSCWICCLQRDSVSL
jgi:hypothetical protein